MKKRSTGFDDPMPAHYGDDVPSSDELLAVIVDGLAAHARGEEVDQNGMEEAATLIAAAELVKAGMPADVVERKFRDEDYTFKFSYDSGTDDLRIDVVWSDDEAPV
jgi:hypothetical protein